MIKKGYQQIKKALQRLPLYWKTWLITSLTLIATLIVFFLVFSVFATKFLEGNQENKFNKMVNQIVEDVEKNGIDKEKLSQYAIEGYTVFISSNNEIIYPDYQNATPLFTTEAAEIASPVESGSNILINSFETGNASLSAQKSILYKNNWLVLDVYYPVIVNSDEILEVLLMIIPYFIVIGMAVSFVVSWIYSRYFVAKINQLNQLVHQMSTSSVSSEYQPQSGDELQHLKNNVYDMYQELQSTMNQLHLEMERVTKLEEDRQVFMRGATHELKTPIMAMMTTLSGMIEKIDGYEDPEYHLSQCYNRLQSMSRLVNEMLEVSRFDEVVFSGETDMNQLTLEVLEVYDYMIQDQELKVTLDQVSEQKVKMPERALQKIVSNLVGNSVKYSPKEGNISIKSTDEIWEISNQVKQMGRLNLETISDPFVSYDLEDDDYVRSHGLGLYIVVSLLEQYHYPYEYFIHKETDEFVFRIVINQKSSELAR